MKDAGTRTLSDSPGGSEHPPFDEVSPDLLNERRYAIEVERGRGGEGRVLEATDRLLGRRVALKELQADRHPSGMARFIREALITARLQHPAIVPIYDLGVRASGQACYSMRLVPGSTLGDAIAAARTMEERLALLPHVQAVADAVAYSHQQGIIHRDLKPANVLVGPFGETVVIDWGLAKDLRGGAHGPAAPPLESDAVAGELTHTGAVLGTPGYMAPEQARGEEVDERADVFALGAVLYHLLAGKPPPRTTDRTPAVEEVDPEAPLDLRAIVAKAMAPDLDDRYATAQELAVDLKRFSTGQLVEARHYSRWALARRAFRRHRRTAAGVLAVLAALVTGAAGIVREQKRTAAENNRLRLMQAQAVLAADPTAAAGWLKTYRVEDGRGNRAVEVAARAAAAGVARHVLTLPDDTPMRVCLDPSARLAGVVGREGGIWLFDLQRATRHRLGVLGGLPLGCSFTPENRYLVAAAMRGGGVVAAPLPGGPVRPLPVAVEGVYSFALAADGRLVVVGVDRSVHVLRADGAAAQKIAQVPRDVESVLFAADGLSLYAAGEGGVWRIPLDGSVPLKVLSSETPIFSLRLSADGRQLLAGSRRDVMIRDLVHGDTWTLRVHEAPGAPLDPHPVLGGALFVASDEQGVTFWQPRTGERFELGKAAFPKGLVVSRDEKRACFLDNRGTIYIADLPGRVVRTIVGHQTTLRSMSMTPDGRWLAIAHGAAARVFALPPPAVQRLDLAAWFGGTIVLPSRSELVAVEGQRRLVGVDARSGGVRPIVDLGAEVTGLTVSPGERRIAAVAGPGKVMVVDVASGAMRQVQSSGGLGLGTTFLDDDSLLATEGQDLHLFGLESSSHRLLARLPVARATLKVSRPAGGPRRVVAATLRDLSIVDADSGHIFRPDLQGLSVFQFVLSHDGRRLAVGSGDGRLMVLGLDGSDARLLPRRDGFVSALAFSGDDRALYAADETGSLSRYDLATGTGQELGRHAARISAMRVAPSGRHLATADVSGEIRLWDPDGGGLLVTSGNGEINSLQFLTEDRVAALGVGTVRLMTFDPALLVPAQPSALARWLDATTSARVDAAGDPVSPLTE
jgi:WD40 repeat protein